MAINRTVNKALVIKALSVLTLLICIDHSSLNANSYDLSVMVKNLGMEINYERNVQQQAADFYKLKDSPIESMRLLINELAIVNEESVSAINNKSGKEHLHIIWCLRGMRFLTGGLFFTAKSDYEFRRTEQKRKYFLAKKNEQEFTFFSTDIAEGIIYFAPLDVQEQVISKWKNWYRQRGTKYNYEVSRDLDKWFF